MPDLGTCALLLLVILGALAAFTLGWISGCECGYQRGRAEGERLKEDVEALARHIWERRN
jgi:hypothetical protein